MAERYAPFERALGLSVNSIRHKLGANPQTGLNPAQVARLKAAGLDPRGNLAPYEANEAAKAAPKLPRQRRSAGPESDAAPTSSRTRSVFSPEPSSGPLLEGHALHWERWEREQRAFTTRSPDGADAGPGCAARSIFSPEPDSRSFLDDHARHWDRSP